MANSKLGFDCCGDRYVCDTTKRCKCGCELTYCSGCYTRHMAKIGELLTAGKSIDKEIRSQRKEWAD